MKILPSPLLPVFETAVIAAIVDSTSLSSTIISSCSFGRNSTQYSPARHWRQTPFWRPRPCTSVTVMPRIPFSSSAERTASRFSGRIIASTFFILFTSRISLLSMLGNIQSYCFFFLANAQAYGRIYDLCQYQSHNEGVHPCCTHRQNLRYELPRIAVEQAVRARRVHRDRGKYARGYRAPGPADAVARPHVEGFVHVLL